MLSDLMLRIEEFPARKKTTAGAIDSNRGRERQDALVGVVMARTAKEDTTALGSVRAPIIATSAVRALGISLITGPAIFFTIVLLSIYGGLPLFFE